jgi:hypothetical protein
MPNQPCWPEAQRQTDSKTHYAAAYAQGTCHVAGAEAAHAGAVSGAGVEAGGGQRLIACIAIEAVMAPALRLVLALRVAQAHALEAAAGVAVAQRQRAPIRQPVGLHLLRHVNLSAHGCVGRHRAAHPEHNVRLILAWKRRQLRVGAARALVAGAVRCKAARLVRHALAQALAGQQAHLAVLRHAAAGRAQHGGRAARRRRGGERACAQQFGLAQSPAEAQRAGAGAGVQLARAVVGARALARAASSGRCWSACGTRRNACNRDHQQRQRHAARHLAAPRTSDEQHGRGARRRLSCAHVPWFWRGNSRRKGSAALCASASGAHHGPWRRGGRLARGGEPRGVARARCEPGAP